MLHHTITTATAMAWGGKKERPPRERVGAALAARIWRQAGLDREETEGGRQGSSVALLSEVDDPLLVFSADVCTRKKMPFADPGVSRSNGPPGRSIITLPFPWKSRVTAPSQLVLLTLPLFHWAALESTKASIQPRHVAWLQCRRAGVSLCPSALRSLCPCRVRDHQLTTMPSATHRIQRRPARASR